MKPTLREINTVLVKLTTLLEEACENLDADDPEELRDSLKNAAHLVGKLGNTIGNTIIDVRFSCRGGVELDRQSEGGAE